MAEQMQKSWMRRRAEEALRSGFQHAYETVRVEPSHFLMQLQTAYELPITNFQGVYSLPLETIDGLSERIVRGGMKFAALEGAGLGLGGIFTAVPDLGILATITLRTVQKLSLVYGFEYNTEEEKVELGIALLAAAGVDMGREWIEKEVVSRFVPRVIRRIAVQASGEVVEKWSGRIIPIASSVIGAGLNYWFVRAWGERARTHFHARHLQIRNAREGKQLVTFEVPPRLAP